MESAAGASFSSPPLVFMREWYMHPSGALPAYEWNFDDLNPRKEEARKMKETSGVCAICPCSLPCVNSDLLSSFLQPSMLGGAGRSTKRQHQPGIRTCDSWSDAFTSF